ncbi:MAG: InlB B-repeat-containing protein [Lachnospiraceae bacterium]|nr:InlB B-repeat-containing protein [Lachnospiraceae bacterium]
MLKRILGCILIAALTLTALPMTAFAKTSNILYGDVNNDGKVDLFDPLMLTRYIADENPSGFNFTKADVNVDRKADLADLLMLRKYLADWNINLGPDNPPGGDSGLVSDNPPSGDIGLVSEQVTVSFFDGDRLIDTLSVDKGSSLGKVPTVAKSSKESAFLEGYYVDEKFTERFYAENPVMESMNVYAKYTDIPSSVNLTPASFAQMDQDPGLSFEIQWKSGSTQPDDAAILTSKDGSDPVAIIVVDNGNGIYTVKAREGFHEGSSYELTLADGWCFKDKEESIRTAAFSIKKEVVDNLAMSEFVHYVQNDNPSVLAAGSTVTCSGVAEGDLLCFYKFTSPEVRDYKSGNAYMDDPETWFKAGVVSDGTVTLADITDEDSAKMYDVPDNFPVIGALPAGDSESTGTLTLDSGDDGYELDTVAYTMMVGTDNGTLVYAKSKVSIGDFISIYASQDSIDDESTVYFGRITAYDSANGTITYVKSSAEEIETAADLYIQPVLEGDDIVSEEAKKKIEATVYAQVKDSGFAEEAAFLLADMATKTDGFRKMQGIQEFLLTDESGNPLSEEEIALLNLGASFELKDGVKLKVEVITSGDQLHFKDKGSVQLAVGVDAQFEVEVEEGKVVINLSATFVQEIALGVTTNGELVKKKILGFIPVPIGVKVGASVDVLSFSGIRVDAQAYTVAEEDKPIWEQLEEAVKNPKKIADLLPDSMGDLKKGLETAGDVLDKIDEIKGKLELVRDDAQKVKEYTEDLEMLWGVLEDAGGMPTEEQWEEMGKTLGKTNISKDLMDMLDLSDETELAADRYAEGMSDLMSKYSKMMERETDWVTLVDKEMCRQDIIINGFVIAFSANFVVRADMNIAMGANLQYEVGKRYNFWVKIGLFKPSAGSETMDLIDEQFAFQYYVMGKLGIRIGVRGKVSFAIGASKAADVGIAIELGPYVKLYGFFIYEYERMREANSVDWVSSQRMAGALYMDFGLYLIVSFEAQLGDDFLEYNYDFVDKEFPLLTAGEMNYPYDFQYEPQEGELVIIRDEDGNSTNGITMILPDEYRALSYCNLQNGKLGARVYPYEKYNFTFSNPNFSMDNNGKISVNVPDGTRYMECDLTITYKYGKMAFSGYDMQVTVPLAWTNLSTAEISEFYTASVRVGNAADGYETVWSKRVRKNQEFTLPTEEEVKELAGYNEAKYNSFSFPASGQTTSLIENKTYDCTVDYKTYSITVHGIQNADGSTGAQAFSAHYGEAFDFSTLTKTGTGSPNNDPEKAKYTKFASITTDAKVQVGTDENGKAIIEDIDLTKPITGKVAQAIANGGVTATANYVDDSVLVTYKFSGIVAPDYVERIRKGSVSIYDFNAVAAEQGMMVKSISPEQGVLTSGVTYMVECGELIGEKYTLSFEENGGSTATDMERVGGGLIGELPKPERTGYTFMGWFADAGLTVQFIEKLMPKENTTLYAKWEANTYTVTYHVNGGDSWTAPETGERTVTYDSNYGEQPVATYSGHGFVGWFIAADGGTQVTADTKVEITENQTLYAHWTELKEISPEVFNFGDIEVSTYAKAVTQSAIYYFEAGSESFTEDSFSIEYMRQGNGDYEESLPVNAGTYNVTISRPADNVYARFEHTYTGVLIINKAVRTIGVVQITAEDRGYTYVDLQCEDYGAIDDLSSQATLVYQAVRKDETKEYPETTRISTDFGSIIDGLEPGAQYIITVKVTNDPNYLDAESAKEGASIVSTMDAPTELWSDVADTSWYSDDTEEFTLTTAEQLAGLFKLVNTEMKMFMGKTVNLGADIDLKGRKWYDSGYVWSAWFSGTFDAQGHTITGVYVNNENAIIVGLFSITNGATIKNLELRDSYIKGSLSVGAIVGYMINSRLDSCVSHAYVKATSRDADSSCAGGMVGYNDGSIVTNCVNYGVVVNAGNHTAGIVGYNAAGYVMNCASFASVTGSSDVGGIVGHNLDGSCWILNCYNAGTVKGTGSYVGAVVGRNREDKGAAHQLYYLAGSATCNGENRNASGTRNGSDDDGNTKNLSAASFTSPTGRLSRDADCGDEDLITALNNWVEWWNDKQCAAYWVCGEDGYPLPTGMVNTNIGSMRQ